MQIMFLIQGQLAVFNINVTVCVSFGSTVLKKHCRTLLNIRTIDLNCILKTIILYVIVRKSSYSLKHSCEGVVIATSLTTNL